jgi:uncharacterized membrane protein
MMSDQSPRGCRESNERFGYWPLGLPFVLLLIGLALVVSVAVAIAGYAYGRIGLSPGWMYAVLVGCFVGSRINIPVLRFPDKQVRGDLYIVAFGVWYRVPVARHTGQTTVAVNVGGAVIPAGLAAYLLVHDRIWAPALAATAVVAVVVWMLARPIPGVGIVTPALAPPFAAAIAATVISSQAVAAVAFVCGTMGTLIGADLANLGRIRDLRAPVVSIGGAGTFDGIFLAGILAVVLASWTV